MSVSFLPYLIQGGKVVTWQATIRIGFTLDNPELLRKDPWRATIG